jgi:hypothetical protein
MSILSLKDLTTIDSEVSLTQRQITKERESKEKDFTINSKTPKRERRKDSNNFMGSINLNKSPQFDIKIERKNKNKHSKEPSSIKREKANNENNIINTEITKINSEVLVRKDFYGTVITKGNKKHKVTFIDKISNKYFCNISDIECFKELEAISGKEKATCNCSCLIF